MCLHFDMKIRPMTKGKTVMRRFAATPGGAASPLPASALSQPQPETAQNAKINPSAKTAQYRNQISTLLGVSPLNFFLIDQIPIYRYAIRSRPQIMPLHLH